MTAEKWLRTTASSDDAHKKPE